MTTLSVKPLYSTKVLPCVFGLVIAWLAGSVFVLFWAAPLALPAGLATGILAGLLARAHAPPFADEVVDCGDRLLIRRRGQEEEILFTEILDVEACVLRARGSGQSYVSIHLARDSRFGRCILFLPKDSLITHEPAARALRARIGR